MHSLGPATTLNEVYFGAMGGVATLSGDASAVITPTAASTSSYDPSNGAAASVFAGTHIRNYVSLQADYVWNRNDVVLTSSVNGPGGFDGFGQMVETRNQPGG